MGKRPKTSQLTDIAEIDKRLATSKNHNATAMMCMMKMSKGEALPEPYAAPQQKERSRSRRREDRSPVTQRWQSPGRERGDRGDRGRNSDRGRDSYRDSDRDRDRDR